MFEFGRPDLCGTENSGTSNAFLLLINPKRVVGGAVLFAIVAIFIVDLCALGSVILVNNFHLSAVCFSVMESWERPVALQPPHNATVITSKAKETCVVMMEEARHPCVSVCWKTWLFA